LILLCFRPGLIAFVAVWQRRFWYDTGAVLQAALSGLLEG
jgi:hypothetical protein